MPDTIYDALRESHETQRTRQPRNASSTRRS